jgi:hypothetical protein
MLDLAAMYARIVVLVDGKAPDLSCVTVRCKSILEVEELKSQVKNYYN